MARQDADEEGDANPEAEVPITGGPAIESEYSLPQHLRAFKWCAYLAHRLARVRSW